MHYRSREQSAIVAAVAVCFFVYISLLTVESLISYDDPIAAVVGILGGVFVGVPLVRTARARAEVEGDQLTVVNTFRTVRVDAEEILEFRLGPKRTTLFFGAAAAQLRDGREIVIVGMHSPNPAFRTRDSSAQKLVDQLNEWLLETRVRSMESVTQV